MHKQTALVPKPVAAERRIRAVSRKLGHAVARRKTPALAPPPKESAADAGLLHASDLRPGIKRRRVGASFSYFSPAGKPVRDAKTLARIRALAIPPAWKEVWICPSPLGHLQATGRDARGRKQYRYHPLWREVRDLTKYHRMVPFGEVLPRIRERVARDLAKPGLGRDKVLAVVVRLLGETLIRVGNKEYAEENHSYGLTTLHDSHVTIGRETLRFRFRGKSRKMHDVVVRDRHLAAIVRRSRDLPGQELFQYVGDDGKPQDVTSDDINAYLHAIAGQEFTAKDFRTWAGTVEAALTLDGFPPCSTDTQTRRNVVRAIEEVSSKLGNTPAVCRKCYVHPFILDAYEDRTLNTKLRPFLARARAHRHTGLTFGEAAVLGLLRDCFSAEAKGR